MTHTKHLLCAVLIAGLSGACSSNNSSGNPGAAGTGGAGSGGAGSGGAGSGGAGTGSDGGAGTGTDGGGTAATTLATSPGCGSINMIVIGNTLYWTEKAKGTVNSVPVAGGSVTVVAMGQAMPGPIAGDATALFWANDGDKTIMKKPLPTGAAAAFAPTGVDAAALTEKVNALLVNNGTLYIGRGRFAFKVPVAGGAATKLMYSPDGDEGLPGAFAVDSTHLYQTELDHQAISREKLDGTQAGKTEGDAGVATPFAPDRMAVSQGSLVTDAIAVVNGYTIWADGTTMKAHPSAGDEHVSHIPLAVSANYSPITGFVISGNTIYLGESSDNKIEKVALTINPDGGSMTEATVIVSGQTNPSQLQADATSIYWVTIDTDTAKTCKISKVAK